MTLCHDIVIKAYDAMLRVHRVTVVVYRRYYLFANDRLTNGDERSGGKRRHHGSEERRKPFGSPGGCGLALLKGRTGVP